MLRRTLNVLSRSKSSQGTEEITSLSIAECVDSMTGCYNPKKKCIPNDTPFIATFNAFGSKRAENRLKNNNNNRIKRNKTKTKCTCKFRRVHRRLVSCRILFQLSLCFRIRIDFNIRKFKVTSEDKQRCKQIDGSNRNQNA